MGSEAKEETGEKKIGGQRNHGRMVGVLWAIVHLEKSKVGYDLFEG